MADPFSDPFARPVVDGARPFELGTEPQTPQTPPPAPIAPPPGPVRSSLFTDPAEVQRLDTALPPGSPTPDEAARIYRMQLKTGLPVEVIRRNLPDVEAAASRADFNPDAFRQTSPLLASWLASDRYHAALAADDIAPLSTWERTLQVGKSLLGAPVAGLEAGAGGIWGAVQTVAEALATMPPTPRAGFGYGLLTDTGTTTPADAAPAPSPIADLSTFAGGAAATARTLAARIYTPPTNAGFLERGLYGALEGAGQMVPALAAGAVGGPEAFLGTLGVGGAGTAYSEARAANLPMGYALPYAGMQGALQAAFAEIPVGKFVGDLHVGAPLIKTVAHAIGSGLPAMEINGALADLNRWSFLEANQGKTFQDYLAERPGAAAETAITATLMIGGMSVVGHGTAQVLGQLGDAAQQSKTVSRVPEKAAEFLNAAAADSALATVRLPVASFTEYFQRHEQDPAGVAAKLTGDAQAYARAQQTGTDLAVPLGEYVTQIGAVPEASTFFANEARFAPDAPNAREVRQTASDVGAAYDAAIHAAGATADPGAAIGESVRSMLEGAGMAPDTARTYAAIYQAHFSTMGERAGLDPQQLFERYGFTVARVTPETVARDRPAAVRLTPEQHAGFAPLLEDARRQGYAGSDEALAQTYAARVAEAQQIAREVTDTGDEGATTFDLLKEISRAGGIGIEAEGGRAGTTGRGMAGELETMLEGLTRERKKTVVIKRGKRAGQTMGLPEKFAQQKSGGVPGAPGVIVRSGGMSLDYMREHLNETPGWAGKFDNLSEFVSAVDHAIRVETGTTAATSGTRYPLAGILSDVLDVKPGSPWWQAESGGGGVRLLEQRDAGRVLGRLRIGRDRSMSVDLFTGSNLATLIHETAHFNLEVLGDLHDELSAKDAATLTDSQRQIIGDYGAVLTWLGVKSRGDIGAAQHEQFARGFEAYMLEGKAPTPALAATFARVRAWLLGVYRSVKKLRVDLTPEIRAVMDRVLASDDAIRAAEADAGVTAPLLTEQLAASLTLTPAERAAYTAKVQAAMNTARDEVQHELLSQLQRERAAWWQDERTTVRAALAGDIARQPAYRALELLQHGVDPDGQPLPEGVAFKLDQAGLVREFGPDILAKLPRPLVYAEDGVPPAVGAELLGYPSAEALVRDLTSTPPLDATLDAAADAEMRRRNGDALTDGTLAEEATRAVLDHRADVFAHEVQLLEQLVTRTTGTAPRPSAPLATIRALAERRVNETAIKDLQPRSFVAAARRAAHEAIVAAGRQDFPAALAAKQQQILNAELHRAATAARESMDTARAGWQPLWRLNEKLATRYDVNLVNAAKALLAQFGLAPSRVDVASVWSYLHKVKDYAPDTWGDLQVAIDAAAQPARPFRELTVEEFRGVQDAVDNLVHLARRTREITIDGRRVELADAVGTLTARLDQIDRPKPRAAFAQAQTKWEATKINLLGAVSALRRVEHWVDAVDGGDPAGVFRNTVWTPVSEATARYREAKFGVLSKYFDLVKGVEASLTMDAIAAPELGYTFGGKVELLHALLHTGNDSNFRKLLLGHSDARPAWGELRDPSRTGSTADYLDSSRWDRFIRRLQADGTLTKADYDYVQATWDLVDSLKADAQRAHHDMYGYYFDEVTARPVETPFGTYRGGYFPAVYDPWLAPDVGKHLDKAALDATPNSFMFPTAGRGFTKTRVETYARPLWLSLRAVPTHLDKVMRFIHLEPAVKDAARVITDKSFERRLHQFDPTVTGDLLVPWLQRTAKQMVETPATSAGGRAAASFFRAIRTRSGLGLMTANVLNTLQQVTQVSIAAVKVPPGALTRALWEYTRGPKALADTIAEKSTFMRTRTGPQVMEMQSAIDDILLNPSTYDRVRTAAARHGYFLQQGLYNVLDHVTWRGAYDTAVGGGATELEAVRQADAAVRQTMGSLNPEDLSKFETGPAFQRAFSMFYSFYNNSANLLGSQFTIAARDMGLRKGAGRGLYVYTFGFLIPAVIGEALMQAGRGQLGAGEDEDGLASEMLALFFGSQLRTAVGFVPIVGPIARVAYGRFTPERYDDNLATSPAVSAIEQAASAPHDVYKSIAEGHVGKEAIRDTLTLLGLLTGLPVAPLGRPLGYLADLHDEKVQPTGPADVARGLVTGR